MYPDDVAPVANYIQDCIKQSGTQGLVLAGRQAGYVEIPRDIEVDRSAYLTLDPLGGRKIPYWYHIDEVRVPTLNYIESQLDNYVKEKTLNCLDNFSAISDKYEITVTGDLEVDTIITEKDVAFDVRYPIIARPKTAEEVPMDKFVSKIPVRFKLVYETAEKILQSEIETLFMEHLTLNLMAGNEEIPMEGVSFDCSPDRWRLSEVTDNVQNLLKYHTANIRVKNTDYPPFLESERTYEKLADAREDMHEDLVDGLEDIERSSAYPDKTPDDAWFYFHSFMDAGLENNNLKANFMYEPEFGIELMPSPYQGEVMNSKTLKGQHKLLRFFCINQYHFTWDIEYPVRAAIYDPESFDGRGYYFDFAFPVTIDNNYPKKSPLTTRNFDDVVSIADEFCQNFGTTDYDIRAVGYVYDDIPPIELNDVTINYKCGNIFCTLGNTRPEEGTYKLKTKLPAACANPFIYAEKQGYLSDRVVLSGRNVELKLTKLRNLSFSIVKYPYSSKEGLLGITPAQMFDETAIINIKSKTRDYETFAEFPADKYIEIIDDTDTYEIDIFFQKGDVLVGGYTNDNLTVDFNEIAGASHVDFNVFEYRPIPRETSAELFTYLMDQSYAEDLRPVFQ